MLKLVTATSDNSDKPSRPSITFALVIGRLARWTFTLPWFFSGLECVAKLDAGSQ
jgi:hypothetical protein